MLSAPVKQKSIVKRRDGQKIIGRWNHDIEDIMNGNVVFKDKKEAIENLQKIQECIEKKNLNWQKRSFQKQPGKDKYSLAVFAFSDGIRQHPLCFFSND